MYAATTSVALWGGDVRPVEVQVHVGKQAERFKLSGLPDTAVREAKDRVTAAIASSGVRFPNRTVTVNLAPAHLPKSGTDFDLPNVDIALTKRSVSSYGSDNSVGTFLESLPGRVGPDM